MVVRYNITNPTGTDVRIKVSGTWVLVESMTNDTAANRTKLHFDAKSGSGGFPLKQNVYVETARGFSYLIIEANSGATADPLYLLIGGPEVTKISYPD